MTEQGRPATGDGLELAALSLGAVIVAAAVATWLGARMATLVAGGSVGGGIGEWLRAGGRLATGDSPSEAWGDTASGLPSPAMYWLCTLVAFVLVAAVLGGLWWMYRRLSPSTTRTRFGQPVQAREATIRDVAPLVIDSVKPPQGRMLLGRMHGNGALLATEDRVRHPLARSGSEAAGQSWIRRIDRTDRIRQDRTRHVGDRYVGWPGRRSLRQARPVRHHRRGACRQR